jgi:hypothetical protein
VSICVHSWFRIPQDTRYLRMKFRTFRIMCGFLVIFSCFLFGQTQSDSGTGLEGVIKISPNRPGPIRNGEPSSGPFANTTFNVQNQNGKVASFTTDDQGRFRISLPPGRYRVAVENNETRVRHCGPFEVEVTAGQMTKADWGCDSGMR